MEGESSVVTDVSTDLEVVKASAVPEVFSFAWLESRIAALVHVDDEPATTKLERYGFAAVTIVGVTGAIVALVLHNQRTPQILLWTVGLQWFGIAVVVLNILRRAWQALQRQHKDFARDLDDQWVQYNDVVNDIRRYPLPTLCAHLRYIRDRKARLSYRAGMISGGFEKFGILPLLAAMYLQIRDWSLGDWKGLVDHVHLLGSVLLWALMIFYAVSWWAVRTKGRLDLYEMLLTEASVRESDET